jgi:hypothetical protein
MESVQEKAQRITGFSQFKKVETAESSFRLAYGTERLSAKSVPWFARLKGIETLLKKAPVKTP